MAAEQGQPALAIADGGEKADALAAQVGPVNHNGRLALEAGQVADGGHQCALGLDGVKTGVGEEAEVALFALMVVLGESGHPGPGQFGEGKGAAVEDGGGEQGQVGTPGDAHLRQVVVEKGGDVVIPWHRSAAGVSDGGYLPGVAGRGKRPTQSGYARARHTGRTVDYAVRLKGNVHIQTADGYQGLLRKYPLRPNRYVFLPGAQYRSDGAATVNLVLYWGRGHREPWYLATSLPDAKVAVAQYRKRMQPEQYFRDGKQYFALDRGTAKTTERLGRMLVGLLLACCLLLLGGRRASWRFRRRVCSWGKLGLLRLGMECYLATPEPPPRWFGLPDT